MTPDHQLSAAGLVLDLGSDGPMTRRLTTALRDAIREGTLAAGVTLPPSRVLAAEAGVSRWVVTEAYGQLVAEGYLQATTGAATIVRDIGGATPLRPLPGPSAQPRPRYDLAPGIPDLAAFPRSRWAEAYRRAVLNRPTGLLADRSPVGVAEARATLTDYLIRTRQVREDPTQVMVTTGAGAAVGWLSRVLVSLGHRRIGVEDPSWPGLREAARRAGLDVVPIPVDDQGLQVAALDDHPELRVVLTTPAHQFPIGVAMAPDRRLELIKWAERVGGLIIEDDYDAEFRYDRASVGSLQGMAPDRVALVGSVSKSLGPAINLGWVIMPQWLIMRVLAGNVDLGVGPSIFGLEAFAIMITEGWYERHLRSMRATYRKRRDELIKNLTQLLPDCRLSGMPAGLHLIMKLPDGTDTAAVVERAAAYELALVSIERYQLESDHGPALVVGYGNLRSGSEREAVVRLAAALAR